MTDESDRANGLTAGNSTEEQLMRAAQEGNLDLFDDLAKQCGDWLQEKDHEERTVLMHAACGGSFRDIVAKVPRKKVRKQLLAKDKRKRSILTHAIIAGDAERLKRVVSCARENLSAEEVLWLFGRTRTGKVANPDLAVKVAGPSFASRVGDSVQRAVEENVADLEKEDAIDKRTSTLQAKILKFVPSEMIIVFQILLAQVASNEWHAFALLLLMTLVSPVVTWAGNQIARDDMPGPLAQLKSRQKPTSSADPKHSWVTILLSAPAFFFWALGTSTVGQGVIGWPEGLCNAFFTVANIVIPIVDAFYEAMETRLSMGDEVAAVTLGEELPPDEV